MVGHCFKKIVMIITFNEHMNYLVCAMNYLVCAMNLFDMCNKLFNKSFYYLTGFIFAILIFAFKIDS